MKRTAKTRAAVLGATGYVGGELLRLLAGHPQVEVTAATSVRHVGRRVGDVFPALAPVGGVPLTELDPAVVAQAADVVFCALPHAHAAGVVGELVAAGRRVVDLSADHRLPDTDLFARTYGTPHPHPELAREAVYGLVEFNRDAIAKARVVGVPGCYPTATLLALVPLLTGGFADPDAGVIVDAKSGVSGAGREAKTANLYCEVAEGVRPYGVGTHRHQPEMAFHARALGGHAVEVWFVPQVVPMARGILACVYAQLPREMEADADAVRAHFAATYAGAPFVEVLPAGTWPETRWVAGTNRAALAVAVAPGSGRVAALCAIDNLVKGAAGQAIQCLNLMLGLPEATALPNLGSVA